MSAVVGFFGLVRESEQALARGHVSAGLGLLDRVPFDESKVKRDKGRFAKKAGQAVKEAVEKAATSDLPAPKPRRARTVKPAHRARAKRLASAFHERWRQTRRKDDGSYEPRVKKTADQAYIRRHGTDQVDIASTSFDELPADWQAENQAAADVVTGLYAKHGPGADLTDEHTRNLIGEHIHQEWLRRNDWARGGELDVPFAQLSKEEQDKDIDQYLEAVKLFGGDAGGGAAPAAAPKPAAPVKKAAAPVKRAAPKPAGGPAAAREFEASRGGVKSREEIGGSGRGNSVELVTFGDGSKAVFKASTVHDEYAKHDFDAEEMGAHVGEVLGLKPPKVHRTGDDAAYFDYVDGTVAAAVPDLFHGNSISGGRFEESPDGKRMGLLDVLIENPDRHQGNWFVHKDGSITPIDHGLGWEGEGDPSQPQRLSGFSDYLVGSGQGQGWGTWLDNDLSPKYVADVGKRLEALKPVFEKAGRGDWHERMMTRLGIVGAHANGDVVL